MKTVDLPHAPPDVAEHLKQARRDDLIVRLADGSEFLLVAIEDFDLEIVRSRNNRRLMALLEARARQTATIRLDETRSSDAWGCKRAAASLTVALDLRAVR